MDIVSIAIAFQEAQIIKIMLAIDFSYQKKPYQRHQSCKYNFFLIFVIRAHIWKWAWHIMGRPKVPKFGRTNFFPLRAHKKPLQKELERYPFLPKTYPYRLYYYLVIHLFCYPRALINMYKHSYNIPGSSGRKNNACNRFPIPKYPTRDTHHVNNVFF